MFWIAVELSYLKEMLLDWAFLALLQPEVFGVKFSLREIERIFSIEIRIFMLSKMPK